MPADSTSAGDRQSAAVGALFQPASAAQRSAAQRSAEQSGGQHSPSSAVTGMVDDAAMASSSSANTAVIGDTLMAG